MALPFERRGQLLAYLALGRTWVPRAEIAAVLWPGQDTKLAYTNLRKALHRLQAAPWAKALESEGGALRFAVPSDVADFEAALQQKRVADALARYRGALLEGFDDAASEAWSGWLAFGRERLRSAWREAALAHLEGEPDATAAIELSARLLDSDPLDEAALSSHLRALASAGRSAQARAAYRDFVTRLKDDLGIAPGTRLQALHDSLFAPASSPKPLRDEGFVGRSVELRQVETLLANADCQVVTVVGPGGAGKTRLAHRALAELFDRYPGGTAFVALEHARTAGDIAGAIARELGVDPRAGDILQEIAKSLDARRFLMVLDNFEHVAGHAASLEALVRGCPDLQLIVTSRARLGIAREQLLPLEGLPWPDAEDQDRFEAFDAVRLFVRAARRVDPAFAADSPAAIVEICRRVEGLPLALELAAGWTRVLSCEAIAAQLREGAQLLHAPQGGHGTRHASMEVVFEQSWRLLGAAERDALARASVFCGGFTADAAKAIAKASLPILGALVDKSLLRREGSRLQMHPLVQHMAGARLAASPLHAQAHRAHAVYYHRLLEQGRCGVEDGTGEALARVEAEYLNCVAAWQWAARGAMNDALMRSALPLLHFCDHRLRLAEGLGLLREALDSAAVREDARLRALLLASAAHMEYRLDRYGEAQANARRALASAPSSDHATRLLGLKVLGGCALWLGELEEARGHYREALREADPPSAAGVLDNLALVEKSMGRYAEALKLSRRSLDHHRRLGDAAGEALCLNNLGILLMTLKEWEAARAQLLEGLEVTRRHGIANSRALILTNLVEAEIQAGDTAAAETCMREALELAQASGQRAVTGYLKLKASEIALGRGNLGAARAELAAALGIARAIGRPEAQFVGVLQFAEILAAQGEAGGARCVLSFVASHESAGAPEREQANARLAALPASDARWPGFTLEALVQRILLETDSGYSRLVAAFHEKEPATRP